jgi:AGCS family alanine or glycine:cation symporter
MLHVLETMAAEFAGFVWGLPLLALLLGGGVFFLLYSRLLPFRYLAHAIAIVRGRYDDDRDPGELSHAHALATALSGTLGLGNVAGVAVAITLGGPGAVFWMWVSAVVGIATKFFTATLGVMYRGRDSLGRLQGGPMYVVREGLGPRWAPLAILFSIAGLFGTLPLFQINQLTQILRDVVAVPAGWVDPVDHLIFDLGTGAVLAAVVFGVVTGDVARVGRVAARIVPAMVGFYLAMTAWLLLTRAQAVPDAFALILTDAFTGSAVVGGAVGSVVLMGVRRGAFSNEAGIGTEVMAHGAARTNEPVREGLVAMLGPAVDTLVVCTCTALAILTTGVWQTTRADGVTLTAMAFETALPGVGAYLLVVMVVFLSLSTVFSFWYYGSKCLGFLIGAEHQHHYVYVYVALVVLGAVASLDLVINLIDGMYALMAIPTMISSLLLAPRVMAAARDYFDPRSEADAALPRSR